MLDLIKQSIQLQNEEKPFIINLIVKKQGSSPREVGAWMIVTERKTLGTIGGGALEFQAIKESREVLSTKISKVEKFILNDIDAKNMGMVCGGSNTVLFFYVDPKNVEIKNLFNKAIEEQDKDLIFLEVGLESLDLKLRSGSSDAILEEEKISFPILGKKKIFIFGGGHIAQQLVPIMNNLNFETTVIEDREEFLTEDLFPRSNRVLSKDYSSEKLEIGIHDYVCVLTRSHEFDNSVVFGVLEKSPRYIGVIGSKRKSDILKNQILESKFKDKINSIYSPVGIKIGAESPFEIALSIAAEIVENYRKSK